MGKKRKRAAESESKQKKKTVAMGRRFEHQMLCETHREAFEKRNLLTAETIREGMTLLGCLTEIKPPFLEMSLPGFLHGRVPLNNISNPFTKSLEDFFTNGARERPCIAFMKVGMVFPCKVMEISQDSVKKESSITLSINPVDVYADLKPSLLDPKMVLYVSVSSIEYHGCVVDVGNNDIKGFLPRQYYQDRRCEFKIGEVIPTIIKQISSDETSARIELSPIDFTNRTFIPRMYTAENSKLTSIFPGMKMWGDVFYIGYPFIHIKCEHFDACANMLSISSSSAAIQVGEQVCGTVLYVHPITHVIYLSLTLLPSPDNLEFYYELRKYATVENLKYYFSYKKFVYYVMPGGSLGFFHIKDLPNSTPVDKVSKAFVLRYHYMDNLIQLSAKPSLLEKNIIFPENVQIGDIYEAIVSRHTYEGMFVEICPGLSGFIREIHMSDVYVTKPEVLYPVGTKVNCRVLKTDGKGKLDLTCKENLLKLKNQYILSSYENVEKGQICKGVIAKKSDNYILVLFFNDVKGIVPSQYIPAGSILYEGQTVLCEVVYCNLLKKRLRLSLQIDERCKIDETGEKAVISNRLERVPFFDRPLSIQNDGLKPGCIKVKAVIQSIKGDKLNITINKNNKIAKGRVHVTELGCTSENTNPLKQFAIGQVIEVYVIAEFMRKKSNYLQISHKNYTAFKECSLRYPPSKISHDCWPGRQLMGIVKEVSDVSVLLWISPYQTGKLDYLNFSENLETVKSLHRDLKIGQSVKVSVLENDGSTVILTKRDKELPVHWRNTIGLVQFTCSARGLVLKLPFGYHGSVAVTDLTDSYTCVSKLFQKYCKLKFLKCHVLTVDHQTKYCQLSLRKSRMYGITNSYYGTKNFCPQIYKDDIKVGENMRGFVKSISEKEIVVELARNLYGKIPIHACSTSNCQKCDFSRSIIHWNPVGNVVKVIVKECFKDRRFCILNLAPSRYLGYDRFNRLDVEEEISWNE